MKKLTLVELTAEMSKEIEQARQRDENDMMIGLRLSGMIKGLEIAGQLTSEEAVEAIINIKNKFNF